MAIASVATGFTSPATMIAMQIAAPGSPLLQVERPVPKPLSNELLIKVAACGVCRTDLHVVDGEVAAHYPIIPGHEIVGHVLAVGDAVEGFVPGQRVGIPWLGHTCGHCTFCRSERKNLCDQPEFTGATRDGGYATHVVADAHFCFALPERFSDILSAATLGLALLSILFVALLAAADAGLLDRAI
jgi:propanol-preferring alcohol dehydrogenase